MGGCYYTGRQMDLRISAPKAGKARLTFQLEVGSESHYDLWGYQGFVYSG